MYTKDETKNQGADKFSTKSVDRSVDSGMGTPSGTRKDALGSAAGSENPTNEVTLQNCKDALDKFRGDIEDAYNAKANPKNDPAKVTDEYIQKRNLFVNSLPKYCQKVTNAKVLQIRKEYEEHPEYEFYQQYIEKKSSAYRYNEASKAEVKSPYLKDGASSMVSGWDVLNAFGLFKQIGRDEGNFVTSLEDDIRVCSKNSTIDDFYKNTAEFKDPEFVAIAKGLPDLKKYQDGMFMYYYTPEFMQKANVETANGAMEGSNELNIPGMMTWAEDMNNSESELVVPSIDIKGTVYEIKELTIDNINTFITTQLNKGIRIENPKLIKGGKLDAAPMVVKVLNPINVDLDKWGKYAKQKRTEWHLE